MKIFQFIVSSIIGHLLLLHPVAHAATLNVPATYSTIQEAINASSNGDTVLVASGTYTGTNNKNLNFSGKQITVISASGPGSTIIDCQNSGRGVNFFSGETSSSIFSGFTIKNGNVANGDPYYGQGGGISIANNSSPTIENCIITDNNADLMGGGVLLKNSSAVITSTTIKNNTAPNAAGIVIRDSSGPQITNSTITLNTASNSGAGTGGGIGIYNSSPVISGSTISYNNADYGGGGIVGAQNSSPTIDNCDIINNVAKESGGGILINDSAGIIQNSTIQYNLLDSVVNGSSGGGVHLINSQTNVTGCNISYNESNVLWPGDPLDPDAHTNSGGISFRDNYTGTIENCTISNNKAQERGGIGCWNASPVIRNCRIQNNSATIGGGGGIGFYNNCSATLENSTVSNNTAEEIGGGIAIWEASPTIDKTTVESNDSKGSAGGISIYSSSAVVKNSIIRNNTAVGRAGITVKTATSSIINTLIYGNISSTDFGSGLSFTSAGNATVTNCTIVKNTSAHVGSGLFSDNSSPVITNTIVWGNIGSEPIYIAPQPSIPTINYSTIQPAVTGSYNGGQGIKTSDPKFVSANDFHLTSGSPCIDTGSNSAPSLPTVDLDGNARIYDPGTGKTGTVDMGVYESLYSREQGGLPWLFLLQNGGSGSQTTP